MTSNYRRWPVSILAAFVMLVSAFTVAALSGRATNTEWTVMVYLDGDNNLDPDSVADIGEMMMVGSTAKVNVLVLWDRYTGPAYLYKVLNGELQLVDGLMVDGRAVNGQEISMTDWHVLKAFVDFGESHMPANHYILDLWDHGNAYGYACWDDHWEAPWYPSPNKALSLGDVVTALQGAQMDILTYDGCTLGMSEIAYQLTRAPPGMTTPMQYLVASEEYIPNSGYAYNLILEQMNSMSDTSPAAVAKMLADVYATTYSPHGQAKGSSTVNLSVVDLAKVGAMIPELKALTDRLVQGLGEDFDAYHELISIARGEANLGWSLNGWDKRIDMGTFLTSLSELSVDQGIKTHAGAAFAALKDAVYVANTPAMESQSAYGLGAFFPTSYKSIWNANIGGDPALTKYTSTFAFVKDAGWMDMLYAYWGVEPPAA